MRTPARRGHAGALDLPLLADSVSFLKLMGLLGEEGGSVPISPNIQTLIPAQSTPGLLYSRFFVVE